MFVSVRFVGPAPHPGRGLSPLHPHLTRFLPPHCPLYLHPSPFLCSSPFVSVRIYLPFPPPCPPVLLSIPPCSFRGPAPAPHLLPAPSLSAASSSLLFHSFPCVRIVPHPSPLLLPLPPFVSVRIYLPFSPSIRLCSPHASPLLPSASPRGRSRKGFGASERPSQRLPVRVCRSRKPCARSWAASSRLS